MSKIKMISKDTDFSKLVKRKVNWDAMLGDEKLDVYRVEGYCHSIGGKWGDNCFWAVIEGEEFSSGNIFAFEGNPCNWGFRVDRRNTCKSKWSATRVSDYIDVVILRNNKQFYTFTVNDIDFAFNKLRSIMYEIENHPVSFFERNYEQQMVGRKIYWREQPAIIARYGYSGNLEIRPDGISGFKMQSYTDHVDRLMTEDGGDGEPFVMEDLFAPSIYWFRENKYDEKYQFLKTSDRSLSISLSSDVQKSILRVMNFVKEKGYPYKNIVELLKAYESYLMDNRCSYHLFEIMKNFEHDIKLIASHKSLD